MARVKSTVIPPLTNWGGVRSVQRRLERSTTIMTNEEVLEFTRASLGVGVTASEFIRAIEAKLKDKNHVAQEAD